MKIDWKRLARTDGYKSLKACYINDMRKVSKEPCPRWDRGRKMRNKKVFLEKFNWVISRAKHYAHHTGKTIEKVLNEWESGDRYWWLNRYQDARQPKIHSDSLKKKSIQESKKIKPRWDSGRKKRGY